MSQDSVTAQSILEAVRSGDVEEVRSKLPEFLLAHEEQIRAIGRRKLTQATRAVYDSEDVLSTVLRRLDAFVQTGNFGPSSEKELWGLIATVARNAAVSKVRLVSRLNQLLAEEGDYVRMFLRRVEACQDDDEVGMLVTELSLWLEDATARQLFNLRLRGATHTAAASVLGISPAACRQRWSAITRQLLMRMQEEGWTCP